MSDQRLEALIGRLVQRFQAAPFHYFSEHELQAEFFGLCRWEFGVARPANADVDIPLFRHEYNTLWRHRRDRRGGSFQTRSSDEGVTGSIDFVVLNADFVAANDLLTVINKDETRRAKCRGASTPFDCAIEFKMAHVRDRVTVSRGALNAFVGGVLEDCRKLAHEGPTKAYVVAFSHAPGPSASDAARVLKLGLSEFVRVSKRDSIALLLATPTTTYVCGDWLSEAAFPNVCNIDAP